jgi:hypothetical protein
LVSYRNGLARLPPRKVRQKGKERAKKEELDPSSDDDATDTPKSPETTENEDTAEVEADDEGQVECAKARAIMNANIGACHVKLVSHFASSLEFAWKLAPGRPQGGSEILHGR